MSFLNNMPSGWMLVLICTLLCGRVVLTKCAGTSEKNIEHFDYCVVGAGPGGIQLGFFLEQQQRSYILLERNNGAASFFEEYPRHRNLISINKKYTPRHGQHPDFKLRHDWNSLLSSKSTLSSVNPEAYTKSSHSAKLLFGNWSDDYYPRAETLVDYITNFASATNINVRYNTSVVKIHRHIGTAKKNAKKHNSLYHHNFTLYLRNTTKSISSSISNYNLSCSVVIVATGLAASNVPENMRKLDENGEILVHGYEDIPLSRDFYRGKDVLILGKGNAAFELASNISAISAATTVVSRSSLRLSYMTHYPGDVRAVNARILDQYQLKSLDALIDISDPHLDFGNEAKGMHFSRASDGRVRLQVTPEKMGINVEQLENQLKTDSDSVPCLKAKRCLLFDVVVRCMGWRFDVRPFALLEDATILSQHADHDAEGYMSCPEGHLPLAPQLNGHNHKYPDSTSWYESSNEAGLYFAGALMHVHDYRRAAGGFIHGYRYMIRALHRHLEMNNHGIAWPSLVLNGEDNRCSLTKLLEHTLDRINSASGLYQMFRTLSDIIVLDRNTGACIYLEEVPLAAIVGDEMGKSYGGVDQNMLGLLDYTLNQQRRVAEPGESVYTEAHEHANFEFVTLFFSYGDEYHGCVVLESARRKGKFNDFLHPRLYHYRQTRQSILNVVAATAANQPSTGTKSETILTPIATHEMPEDLETNWRDPKRHIKPLSNFLQQVWKSYPEPI